MKKTLLALAICVCSLVHAQKNFNAQILTNVIIDGNLHEWEKIPFSEAFVIHHTEETPSQVSQVKVAWDYDNLFLAYKIADTDLRMSTGNQDSKIFKTSDLVEFFIDPDADGINYLEVGVNGNNVYYDYILKCVSHDCGGWADDQAFDLDEFESASTYTGTLDNTDDEDVEYIVEVKIPFSSLNVMPDGGFTTPVAQDVWKANFFRVDRSNNGLPVEYQSWSPYEEYGYHQPEKFGTITFDDTDVTTGVIDISSTSTIQLFPNPSTGIVNLTRNADVINVYNATGNLITTTKNSNQINLTEFNTGLYTLTLVIDEQLFSEQIFLK